MADIRVTPVEDERSIESLLFELNKVDENIGTLITSRRELIDRVSTLLSQATESVSRSHAWYESKVQGYSSPTEGIGYDDEEISVLRKKLNGR